MSKKYSFTSFFAQPYLFRATFFIGALFLSNLLFLFLGWYDQFAYLDDISHFSGGVSIAFFLFQSLAIFLIPSKKKSARVRKILTVVLTMAIAIIWEFLEYSSDSFLGTDLQQGVGDTIVDLLIGTLGAALFVIVFSPKDIFPAK